MDIKQILQKIDQVNEGYRDDDYPEYDNDGFDYNRFSQKGSALHPADENNPRDQECPTCSRENVLTRRDVAKGYQCDDCADRAEGKKMQWESTKLSLKNIFNKLSEDATVGMKPFAVLDPKTNKPGGAAVLKSPNPAVQNMIKGLKPTDLQVVMTGTPVAGATTQPATTGATTQPATTATTTQPATTATTTQPATTGATTVREEQLDEKAPPGMENVVLSLKKKFPGEEERAYKIAWSMYNKKHGKQMDEESYDSLTLRSLSSANPQSQPDYAYKTQKGKVAAAKKNIPDLIAAIRSSLGKHPKPNLPEEGEQMDEVAKKAVVKTNKPVGYRIADIGPGGKEHNVETDKAWDDQMKKEKPEQVSEKAKWRSSAAAQSDDHWEDDDESGSRSTGRIRATSDPRGDTGGEYDHTSLQNRRKAKISTQGQTKGKTTAAHNRSLKGRIGANLAKMKGQEKPNLPEDSTGEEYVVRKGKHGSGPASTMAGHEIDGVTIKRTYIDKEEAQQHADILNGGPDGGRRGGGDVAYVVSVATAPESDADRASMRDQMIAAMNAAKSGHKQVTEKWGTETKVSPSEKGKYEGKTKAELLKRYNALKKSGPHKKGSKEYGEMRELAFAVRAKSDWGKVKEAEIPSSQMDMGAGLGAGRNEKVLESTMRKTCEAAYHEGKSHGLGSHGYNCRYDEGSDEHHNYHRGFKEGLDECYDMKPIQGLVIGEETPPATIPGMANQAMPAMEAGMEEGNAFTAALAKTPKGGKFTVGGKTFTDRSGYNSTVDEMAFESLDRQLNALLNENTRVSEGMSVALTQGLQGIDDSVNVSATDADADKLLAFVKQAALGNLGDSQSSNYGAPVDSQGHASVDEHDSIMSLIKKMSGGGAGDYEQEATSSDSGCGCGQTPCECEAMQETESEDQMEYEVAEDNAPDSDEAETSADENAEAAEDQALAMKSMSEGGDGGEASEEEEELTEWANNSREDGTDEAFLADIDFMTRIISGGLNKQKRDQTTLPHTAVKVVDDPITEWKKLSGIKK